ncbi:alpha/beta hydrolase fold domain-containing protein [Rhizoctonia solani AG-1 IA]|uniref:Alpha/beta hydrolase fold domain-containing protein n=1 Tax=Thanatephorus cucumeris (strain AG1-IA) TaxID=983506 RepID=L8WVS6_THACA|nr:alpha/beta hydrolase fold domain-containing protein [Rhizoctonia solani AG-1 IA]
MIQNGVGIETWIGATQVSPGVVDHLQGVKDDMGLFPSNLDPKSNYSTISNSEDGRKSHGELFLPHQVVRPQKLILQIGYCRNCAWNSLTALTNTNTLEWLTSSSDAEALSRDVMKEVITVAQVHTLMDRVSGKPLISSMQVDAANNRPMETEVRRFATHKRPVNSSNYETSVVDSHSILVDGLQSRWLSPGYQPSYWINGDKALQKKHGMSEHRNTSTIAGPSILNGPIHPDLIPYIDAESAQCVSDPTELGINPLKITIGGSSAGGNLGAVITQRAAQRSPPLPIMYQVLMTPVTDNNAQVWSKLPDAWMGVGELDMSKSEGEECAHKLEETGKRLMLSCIQVGSNLDLGHGVISEPIIGASHKIMTMDKMSTSVRDV